MAAEAAAAGGAAGRTWGFRTSGFVFRRTLALGYFAAFLSFAAQADGLFGCSGVFPPKAHQPLAVLAAASGVPASALLTATALLGAAVAGAALVAAGPCERHARATFAVLWAAFAGCVGLAPSLYPAGEDQLLLEAGVVALFLACDEGGTAHSVGRALARWLLFRAVFAPAAEKVTGTCSAWRNLTALGDMYQLEAFPLPSVWLLWLAPPAVPRVMTCLQLYVELVLSPLVLVPSRSVVVPAVTAQLVQLLVGQVLANRGYLGICLAALALASLDDGWHDSMWSERLLLSWGCFEEKEDDEENGDEAGEEAAAQDGGAQEASGQDGSHEHADQEESPAAAAVGAGDSSGAAMVTVSLLLAVIALAAALAAAASRGGPGGGLLAFFDPERKVGRQILEVVVVAAALAAAGALLAAAGRACIAPAASPGAMLRAVALGAVGCALLLAGLLQLSRDLHAPGRLPAPLEAAADALEALHVAHALGAASGEVAACPHVGGRADLVLQGLAAPEQLGTALRRAKWLPLSSRFLVAEKEDRPAWIQPYTPRLDRELWRLAQRPGPEAPGWVLRLLHAVSKREGSGARLSAGLWDSGPSAALHGTAPGGYPKVALPFQVVRVVWQQHQLDPDVHSNRWWNTTTVRALEEMDPDGLERYAGSLSKCSASAGGPLSRWMELPLAEALLSLVAAALLWKVVVQGAM